MRYMLTGDHWTAHDAYRMGTVQEIAETPEGALNRAIEIANKVAACGPLGVKTSLASAHLAIEAAEEEALSKLDEQFGGRPCDQNVRLAGVYADVASAMTLLP